ncbi:MAG: hypothetical protein WC364_13985 [Eubacteriales bacterium]|jgi:uncharacterized Zn finger protein (UPF0148 family)
MRTITVKYQGECRKCGTTLIVGESAIYEKHVGLFCPTCEPKDSEEIRGYRQEAADRRADRYDGWAEKRKEKASAQLNSYPEIRHDIAFCTQPGHIPFRDRMNKADERAFQSLQVAQRMEAKADSLRHVRVKGDAEKRWQSVRDFNLTRFKVGDAVDTGIYGRGTIVKFNKKTVKISDTGASGTATLTIDLAFISPIS